MKKGGGDDDDDESSRGHGGLNELPDDVIQHILSFLPARSSAQTSILARRWRFLWTHAPLSFIFDIWDYDFRELYQLSSLLKEARARRFVFNISLSCCDVSFCIGHPNIYFNLDKFFSALVQHNVQTLDISLDLDSREDQALPLCIFACKTLVDLRIREGLDIRYAAADHFVSLPRLKKLLLVLDIDFPYHSANVFLSHLLSGCPVLEELVLEGSEDSPGPCLNGCTIASTTLKRLTVAFRDDFCVFDPISLDRKVIVNAPALRYLEMEDHLWELISPTHSLIEARIKITEKDDQVTRCVLKLLDTLCSVKSLTFLCSTWGDGHNKNNFEDYMEEVGRKNVKFDRLTRLVFDAPWPFLFKFLESAHHIQVLIIPKIEGFSKEEQWVEPLQVPKWLSSHVRRIRVAHFEQREDEFEVVRYLLRSAQLLERMEIDYPPCREDVQTDHSESN